MAKHHELGKIGEKLAVDFLLNKHYTILETNFRIGKAEIDIIAKNADFIVFVEVKTRSTFAFGNPEEGVSERKQELFQQAAENYLNENNFKNTEIRFDVISIVIQKGNPIINHNENAFN